MGVYVAEFVVFAGVFCTFAVGVLVARLVDGLFVVIVVFVVVVVVDTMAFNVRSADTMITLPVLVVSKSFFVGRYNTTHRHQYLRCFTQR